MAGVLTEAAQATPDWLNLVLRRSGQLLDGEVASVSERRRDALADWTVVHLEVSYRGYTRLPRGFLLKLSLPAGGAACQREHEFYWSAAPAMLAEMRAEELPFGRCFDYAFAPEIGRGHVLLEDLAPTHSPGDRALPPTEPQSDALVDTLASLHAFWWEHPRLGRDLGPCPAEADLAELLSAAAGNLRGWFDLLGDRISPGRRATYERACGAWPARRVTRLLSGQGLTLLNGDAWGANCLFPKDAARDGARLAGWGAWRLGPGTDDLAYLIAAGCYPERRSRLERPLLERYHQRLQRSGVLGYNWDDCWYDYRASIVWVLFSLIGGRQPGHTPAGWYDQLERATQAYEGLGCAGLLP